MLHSDQFPQSRSIMSDYKESKLKVLDTVLVSRPNLLYLEKATPYQDMAGVVPASVTLGSGQNPRVFICIYGPKIEQLAQTSGDKGLHRDGRCSGTQMQGLPQGTRSLYDAGQRYLEFGAWELGGAKPRQYTWVTHDNPCLYDSVLAFYMYYTCTR